MNRRHLVYAAASCYMLLVLVAGCSRQNALPAIPGRESISQHVGYLLIPPSPNPTPKPTPTCALPWVAGVDQCVIPMYPNQTTMTFGSQVGGNDPSPPFMPYLQEIASCSPSCLPITYYQCQPSMCNPANT